MTPYANEADVLKIGDLTIENRTDRISVYGSLELTKDKVGRQRASDLKSLLEAVLIELARDPLPDQIALVQPKTVKNPFGR